MSTYQKCTTAFKKPNTNSSLNRAEVAMPNQNVAYVLDVCDYSRASSTGTKTFTGLLAPGPVPELTGTEKFASRSMGGRRGWGQGWNGAGEFLGRRGHSRRGSRPLGGIDREVYTVF